MSPFPDPFRSWPRIAPWTKGRPAERHPAALKAVLADPPPYPGGEGDGIVIVGGGKYWPGAAVACRIIRRLQCNLPVQAWYRSSCEAVRPADVAGLGVDVIDMDAAMDALADTRAPRGRGMPGGFEAKVYAVAHAPFRRLLYLDADAYPVTTPCRLFEELNAASFAFWADVPELANTARWHKLWPGGEAMNLPPVQAGQFLIDREAGWPLLAAAHWMNEHSDYYYQHGRDDQDCWRAAIAATGTPYALMGQSRRVGPALVCDRSGRTVVVHRVAGKLFPGTTPPRDDRLPLEREVFEEFAGLDAEMPAVPLSPPPMTAGAGCCPGR